MFNTFTTQCLKDELRDLNGLADINIESILRKGTNNKIPFTVKDHLKVEGMI